jgi:UrcA family protein
MTPLLKTIGAAAGIAMAALAATGAASSAQAEPLPVRIQVADLNLSTPQGRAAFDFRVAQAVLQMCEDQGDLHSTTACERAVRDEATDNLAALARREGISLAPARH